MAKSITTDRKLDVMLAAMRGADMSPQEIVLKSADHKNMDPMTLAIVGLHRNFETYRGIPVRRGNRSYIVVDVPSIGTMDAPVSARDFVRWFPVFPDRPPPAAAAVRRRKAS